MENFVFEQCWFPYKVCHFRIRESSLPWKSRSPYSNKFYDPLHSQKLAAKIIFEKWNVHVLFQCEKWSSGRGGYRTAATSKMEHFVIIVNDWKSVTIITKCSILEVAIVLDPLTIITKSSILDVAAALDPPLSGVKYRLTQGWLDIPSVNYNIG